MVFCLRVVCLPMDDPVTPSRGSSRLMRIVLVLSLALNLAVVGIVAGVAVSGRLGGPAPRSVDFGLGPVSQALDPAERRAIRQALRREGALRNLDLRARAEAMIAALRADPFDRAALELLLDEQAARIGQLQGAAQEAFLDQIAAMTPERRAAFAERLMEAFRERRAPRQP